MEEEAEREAKKQKIRMDVAAFQQFQKKTQEDTSYLSQEHFIQTINTFLQRKGVYSTVGYTLSNVH